MKRFHLTDGKRKTTVTLHNRLADYLAVALGVAPDSPEAHGKVSAYLSDTIVSKYGHFAERGGMNPGTSALAQEAALDLIVSNGVEERYWAWRGVTEQDDQRDLTSPPPSGGGGLHPPPHSQEDPLTLKVTITLLGGGPLFGCHSGPLFD